MAPTAIGVPVALLLAPVAVLAGVLAAAPVAVLAGALLELDDEDEQPAAVSAARASAVTATPVDLRPSRLRPVSLRVIFASFLPGYQAGPGRLSLMFSAQADQLQKPNKLNNLSIICRGRRPGKG
jgi:hypothetical protein